MSPFPPSFLLRGLSLAGGSGGEKVAQLVGFTRLRFVEGLWRLGTVEDC